MTSCGRGRDSATLECFGRGYRGTIFFRSSKLSLFLPVLCPFRRVFFCFLRFWMIWRQMFKLWGFWFRRCFGALLETPLRHRAFFTNSYYDHKYFLEIPFFFKKQRRFYLPDSYGDPKSEQSTLVMVRRKPEWNPTSGRWRDRAQQDHRSSSRLVQVVCDDPWSWKEKKKHKEISVWFAQSTNQRVLRSLFPRRDVATVSHFAIFMDVDVQLQDGQAAARGQRRKAVIRDISGVDHWGVTNLSAPIWFTGQRHCTVFRHVMQLWMLVLCWKSTLTAILAQDHFQTLATVVPKLKTWLGTQLGPRRQNLTHALSGQSNRGKFLSLGNSWRREIKLDWEWCERTRSRRSERWTTRKNRRAVVSPLLAMNPFLRTSRISRWGQDHSELPLRFLLCFLQLATSKTIAKNLFSWSKVVQFVGNQLQDFPETSKPFIVNNTPR